MPRQPIRVANLVDMTGGLNLNADAFQLGENESPDLLNVDVDPRGGFRQRKTVAPLNPTALSAAPQTVWSYTTTAGTKQVLVSVGAQVLFSTGSDFTAVPWTYTTSGRVRAATFGEKCYLFNGFDAVRRWDGSTGTALPTLFNDNFASPSNAGIVAAFFCAVHHGSLWIANTLEGSTRHRNRVRWSHPNKAEDFRSFDYIDIDVGRDGDEITAIAPYGDRLLVFKRNSVHVVHGNDPQTFTVQTLTDAVGAVSQEAVVVTEVGVFFFSWPEGLMWYDGRSLKGLWGRLRPTITDGKIPDAYQSKVAVGYGGERVWVSVPYEAATVPSRTFVYDPAVGKEGAWTFYDLACGAFLSWQPPGQDSLFLGCGVGSVHRVLKLDQDGAADDFGGGAVHIDSHYRTRWVDLGQPGVEKRWRRPEVVARAEASCSYIVESYRNYDPTDSVGSFTVSVDTDAGGVWDTALWDSAVWAREAGDYAVVERGSPSGIARALQYKFNGPTTNHRWGVDAIAVKYQLRRVRG